MILRSCHFWNAKFAASYLSQNVDTITEIIIIEMRKIVVILW